MGRSKNRFSGICLSAFVYGKKKKKNIHTKKNTLLYKIAKSTGMKRCKTLTIVLLRIIQEKRKLSLKEVVMFGLPEQLLLEI